MVASSLKVTGLSDPTSLNTQANITVWLENRFKNIRSRLREALKRFKVGFKSSRDYLHVEFLLAILKRLLNSGF